MTEVDRIKYAFVSIALLISLTSLACTLINTLLNQHHIHQNRGYQPHTNKSTKPQKPPIGTRGDDA